jgi:hypothetical protein
MRALALLLVAVAAATLVGSARATPAHRQEPPRTSNALSSVGELAVEGRTPARAAGVTPILRGTPLYDANRRLDRDEDGIACE